MSLRYRSQADLTMHPTNIAFAAEDIVPRLLAMRYAASLPAAAADTMSQPQEVTAQDGSVRAGSPEPKQQDRGLARLSWRDTSASAAESPSKATWHASLSSSMDKLRALTGTTAASRAAPDPLHPSAGSQHRPSTTVAAQSRQEAAAHEQSGGLQQSGLVGSGWAPARYLPTFVPFGGQHHLLAPATAQVQSGTRPGPATSEAEDAEALAALEAQEGSSAQVQASAGRQEEDTADHHPRHSAISTEQAQDLAAPPEHFSSQHSPELQGNSRAQAEAERVAVTRRYALPLSYHRMYTMRERAAAICSAAWPVDADSSSAARQAVQLSQKLAPQMLVTAASAQLPVWPPSPSLPSTPEAANRRCCYAAPCT